MTGEPAMRPPGARAPRRLRVRALGATIALLALVFGTTLLLVQGSLAPAATPAPTVSPAPALASGLDLVAVAPPTAPVSSPDAPVPSAAASIASLPPTSPSAASVTPSPSPTITSGIRATRIHVDRLGIDLPIVQGDGIDAPLGKVAHYPTSAWPGGGSNIYLYAHARTGMFLALWQARVGDLVRLDLADGTSRSYRVTRVLPRVPYNAMQYLAPTPAEQLTLQTCTAYEATAPRFLVIAVPTQ